MSKAKDYFGTEEKFNVIYVDPPWKYAHCTITGKTDKHYKTMSLAELKKMPVKDLAADHCALVMWATNPKLEESFQLFDAWGFEYKTVMFAWVKQVKDGSKAQTNGLSWYTRPAVELCLIGMKGNLSKIKGKVDDGSCKVQQLVIAPKRQHSRKPEEVRVLIEQFFSKESKKIELFARESRKGWTTWGDEKQKFDEKEEVN